MVVSSPVTGSGPEVGGVAAGGVAAAGGAAAGSLGDAAPVGPAGAVAGASAAADVSGAEKLGTTVAELALAAATGPAGGAAWLAPLWPHAAATMPPISSAQASLAIELELRFTWSASKAVSFRADGGDRR